MTNVHNKAIAPSKNQNLKQMAPKIAPKMVPAPTEPALDKTVPNISDQAKELSNQATPDKEPTTSASDAVSKATSIAKQIPKLPIMPIIIPKETKKLQQKLDDTSIEKIHQKMALIEKPAVIFIEGFSMFGISNGDGIKDMADNFSGAKRFSWDEQDKIIEEISKHAPDQPVVLVGHSYGGDSAVEVANELNSAKHGFRSVDLLVGIDSVGTHHTIIPMNVKRNLNFFGEGIIPFLHGDPSVARNTDYTNVINELRTELHSRMDDSPEVQYKIFENIQQTIKDTEQNKHLEKIIAQAVAQNSGNI